MAQQASPGAATAAVRSGTGAQGSEPHSAVQSFSRTQMATVLLIGVLSSLVVVLQPLVLGPLAAEGRLTVQEIGRTAMLEMLGMAIAVAVSGAFFRPRRLRSIILAAVVVSVLANGATIIAQHEMILAARLINGLTVGVLLWVWTGLLTRVELPARLLAIFLTLQSAGALALSSVFSAFVIPRIGASGGYACLAIASAIAGLLAVGAPSEYRAHGPEEGKRFQLPSGRGLAGLLAVLLHQAGIMAFWVYVLPLGREKGLSDSFVGVAVSVSLASQIAGGLCAAVFARLNAKVALYGSLAGSIAGLVLVGMGTGHVSFVAGLITIVFLWMFAPAYQMPYLLEVDASRRAAMQMITAQLLGLSLGPALASFAVQSDHVSPAIWASGGLYAAAALLIFATTALRAPAFQQDALHGQAKKAGSPNA